jgi:hypothetical protein
MDFVGTDFLSCFVRARERSKQASGYEKLLHVSILSEVPSPTAEPDVIHEVPMGDHALSDKG